MGSREELLRRVRAARGDRPAATPDAGHVAPAAPRTALQDLALVELLEERLRDYGAGVRRCGASGLGVAVGNLLGARGVSEVVVPAGLEIEVPGVRLRRDEPMLTVDELDRAPAAMTRAAVAVAETGSVVLDHQEGQGRRVLSLIPDLLVMLVALERVVADVPDALALLASSLRDGRPLTWISGPSATSDIELSRVVGVHGPRQLEVVLVEP